MPSRRPRPDPRPGTSTDSASAPHTAAAAPAAPVSITAVARLAGVSIATVSRVINGVSNKASADTERRVREAVATLGYRPMDAGRNLRRRDSRLVAVLAANLANPSMAAMAAATEAALRRAGRVMVLCDTHDDPALQDETLQAMRAHFACGFVLLGAVASPLLTALDVRAEPVVFVNRRNPSGDTPRFVGIDNRAAGAEVARWLLEHGARRPALVHGPLTSSATRDRVDGFAAALAEAGVALPATRRRTLAGRDHLGIGHGAMQALLAARSPPDAVFCTSDLIAYGVQRALAEAGTEAGVPGRLPIVGFDDNPLNPWVAPWLHAVRVPYARYGEAIVQAMSAEPPIEIVLPHRLIARPAPPPPHAARPGAGAP